MPEHIFKAAPAMRVVLTKCNSVLPTRRNIFTFREHRFDVHAGQEHNLKQYFLHAAGHRLMIPGLGQNACGLKLFRVTKLTSFQRCDFHFASSFPEVRRMFCSRIISQCHPIGPSKIETVPVSEEDVNERDIQTSKRRLCRPHRLLNIRTRTRCRFW